MQNKTDKPLSKAQLLDEWTRYRNRGGDTQRENLSGLLYAGALLEWAEGDPKKALRELYLYVWDRKPHHPEIETVAALLNDLLVEHPNPAEDLDALVTQLELKARKLKAEKEIASLTVGRVSEEFRE